MTRMSKWVAILAAACLGSIVCGPGQGLAGVATQEATLEHGAFGADLWQVSARRLRGGHEARDRPCLAVLIAQPIVVNYEGSTFEVCGAVTSVPTLIHFSIGDGEEERTVIAMAFGVNVRRILVDLGSRGKRRIRPKLLPMKVVKKLDLERFRFATIPLAGPHCLRRILGTEADGEVAVDKNYRDCTA